MNPRSAILAALHIGSFFVPGAATLDFFDEASFVQKGHWRWPHGGGASSPPGPTATRDGAPLVSAEEFNGPGEAEFEALFSPETLRVRQRVIDQTCAEARKNHPELSVGSIDALPGYKVLFQRLADRRVLLAGDSFMRNFFKAMLCAAEFLGVKPKVADLTPTLPKWEYDDKVFYWSMTIPGVPRSLIRSEADAGKKNSTDTFGLQVSLLYYYTLTETCTACSFVEGEPCNCEEDIVPTPVDFEKKPKMAGEFMKLRMQTLARILRRDHDEAVVTIGHDMMKWMPQLDVGRVVKRKLQRLWQVLEEEDRAAAPRGGGGHPAGAAGAGLAPPPLARRVTFMEHYAQHFPAGGTGDFDGILNHTSCPCNLPRLQDQRISQRLHVLKEFCDEHGVRVATTWRYTAQHGCTLHDVPDCSHYAPVPKFWDPIALEVASRK